MECVAMILRLNKGKTNQANEGKTNQANDQQLGSLIRHREIDVCTFGATAFYLFFRGEIKKEIVPNLFQTYFK